MRRAELICEIKTNGIAPELPAICVLKSGVKNFKTLGYIRGIAPKRVTSGRVHLRGLALGQHSIEETSQRWRGVGDPVCDFTVPEIEPRSPAPLAVSPLHQQTSFKSGVGNFILELFKFHIFVF